MQIEAKTARPEEPLRRHPFVGDEAANFAPSGAAVQQPAEPVALGQRAMDARLPRVVAERAIAVDRVDFAGAGAEHAQGDAEIVSRPHLGDSTGKSLEFAMGKVVVACTRSIYSSESSSESVACRVPERVASLPRASRQPRPPVIRQIVETGERDAPLDQSTQVHPGFSGR